MAARNNNKLFTIVANISKKLFTIVTKNKQYVFWKWQQNHYFSF